MINVMLLFLLFQLHDPKKCLALNFDLRHLMSAKHKLATSCFSSSITSQNHGDSSSSSSISRDGENEESSCSSNSKRSKSKGSIMSSTVPPPDPSTFPSWAYEPRDFFKYEIIYQSKKSMARVGRIHTPHGIIDTPGFVAVATNGALKGVDFRNADDAGQQLAFCNTYHLLLQPGAEVIADAGGLHKFMNRPNQPLITDSGGFQVFSLAYGSVQEELSSKGELKRTGSKKYQNNNHNSNVKNPIVKVTEEGVEFRSYRDGKKIFLSPESTVLAQKGFGADIIIPLDELPPYHIERQRLVDSVQLSHRWEARSLRQHLTNVKQQAMYCVVHGGIDVELRTKSVEYLTSLPFDGYAIGGSLGNGHDELFHLLRWMMPMFDATDHRRGKPRHLLGIADETSIDECIALGIDTFDSCFPTRLSRHGTLLTRQEGKLHIKSTAKHSKSYGIPIDPECKCSTCQHYDRAYLNHLVKASEPLFLQLAGIHNIHYMNDLMARKRQEILDGKI